MSHDAVDPNEYEWRQFLRGHRQQMEDALLPTLAEAQEAGVIPDPAKQIVPVQQVGGITVEYPDGEPPPGTPMTLVTFFGHNGEEVQVPMPASVGPKGIRVRINGVDGLLFNDEDGDLDAVDEEVEVAIRAALNVHAKQVGHNGVTGLYGIAVSDTLRDELVEAWDDHYLDHGCKPAAQMLDRILEQLIEAFKENQ